MKLKKNEYHYQDYMGSVTCEYKVCVTAIERYFEESGYLCKQSVGVVRKSKQGGHRRVYVVANILARKDERDEIAGVLYFPRTKTTTTTDVIRRLERLYECFDQTAVFLCGKNPSFPYIVRRIREKFTRQSKQEPLTFLVDSVEKTIKLIPQLRKDK